MSKTTDPLTPGGRDKSTVLRIYAALCLSLLLGFIPVAPFAFLSAAVFVGTLIAAYIVRRKAEAGQLSENHMTYIIRTMWIVALISLITVTIGSIYMLSAMDTQALALCLGSTEGGVPPTYESFRAQITPCMKDFMADNTIVFATAGFITIFPVALYLIYRIVKGFRAARKALPVENVKKWF